MSAASEADRSACWAVLSDGLDAALRVDGISDALRADLEASAADLEAVATGTPPAGASDPDAAWWADVAALCRAHDAQHLGSAGRMALDALARGAAHHLTATPR